METLLVATLNKHKLYEIGKILKGFKIYGKGIEVNEDGKTFEENALKKAAAVFKKFKKLTIADDSGLVIDCLDGKPGIKSARFATPPTPQNLCRKVLDKMKKCKSRQAHFVCSMAIIFHTGKIKIINGFVYGEIANEMRGENGFGYDSIFIPSGFTKTFGEMTDTEKNKVSHRARALAKVKEIFSKADKTK
ncbi:non-canonical purine NTP pyrophosphatase, RdgB/HAM1 family [candidate division WOR-1 bacterium RIFOXYC2_FULL_37_10]|uniref:dITP/XTP pyrophosphatase n=1 Tax=candidate division WOR-1 bacterium RIFOXYB2_FULL_37_13 TaxID=1802579 RepID=A0A1F4SMX0_UNCSA|nr:MAG: non-canonical purine NTP pyrophosphatase, RdgB/HAM1 family [candidate division WOR-1 bacterium RIFOXYA2_FULL_37_7]OGC21707.1 MAG: non-canonical purine NTP pyrophosphatase, RdgB/HAM1 family [candidate division WOR-1 bacterium RIFOXYB2_FULL_37_13]OGC32570.1 MAG: non-canonical purine NTP pyrophosphatase, RdgB/HAM1 family [candidate division WOR-1 bacterium RIFOXYC2_FULL_37_10]